MRAVTCAGDLIQGKRDVKMREDYFEDALATFASVSPDVPFSVFV